MRRRIVSLSDNVERLTVRESISSNEIEEEGSEREGQILRGVFTKDKVLVFRLRDCGSSKGGSIVDIPEASSWIWAGLLILCTSHKQNKKRGRGDSTKCTVHNHKSAYRRVYGAQPHHFRFASIPKHNFTPSPTSKSLNTAISCPFNSFLIEQISYCPSNFLCNK